METGSPYRTPAHLLGLRDDPALWRLMRACGAPEACITGGASDCDRFLALADAMPRLAGHPTQAHVNRILTSATGLTASLCPHTARAHWEAFVKRHWYADALDAETALANGAPPPACPCCAPCEPLRLPKRDLSPLPDPLAIPAYSLSAWSEALEHVQSSCRDSTVVAAVTLPAAYTFVRPDPYHVGQALERRGEGEALTQKEQDLLLTQALRVWGLAAARDGFSLLLRGGVPAEITALLAYLQGVRALPALTWIPDDPTDAGAVSGLYSTVRTGFDPSAAPDAAARYATVAPLGTAVMLTEDEEKDEGS